MSIEEHEETSYFDYAKQERIMYALLAKDIESGLYTTITDVMAEHRLEFTTSNYLKAYKLHLLKEDNKMKTVKEQFESMLPMTINCGHKKKVRKLLKAMGCEWYTGCCIVSSYVEYQSITVDKNKRVTYSIRQYPLAVRYKYIKTLIKQYKAELKQPEFTYPMYFRSSTNNQLVKFTSLSEGIVVEKGTTAYAENVGTARTNYIPHTDGRWTHAPHDTDTGFYDKQPIFIAGYLDGLPSISLWDNINKRAFSEEGSRNGFQWEYYWPMNKLDEAIKPYLASLED